MDDDPRVLRALERVFQNDPLEVRTTEEPVQALEWVRTARVGVIIADQRMPGMKGTELLHEVGVLSPATGRVLLTAYPGDPLVVSALGQSRISMIGKPWDDAALRRTVADLLAPNP